MEYIYFIENPPKEDGIELENDLINANWSRIRGQHDIWVETQDYFLYLLAFDSRTNQAVGSITLSMDRSSCDPNDVLYYIGTFYTKPSHRGIGLALELFRRVMDKTEGKNVALNATVDTMVFYEKKFGFTLLGPCYYNFVTMKPTALALDLTRQSRAEIKKVSDVNFSAITAFDQTVCKRQRSKYLNKWLTDEYATSKVAVDSSGTVLGFICIRPQAANRVTVGPFYADSEEVAYDLLNSGLAAVPNLLSYDMLWMRFPDPNEAAFKRVVDKVTNRNYDVYRSVKTMFNKKLIIPEYQLVFSVFESSHSLI